MAERSYQEGRENKDPMDLKAIFFTNLQLLGFDPVHMEKKLRIPFNKDMFLLPNKHGFEVVMHFLFNRLDPTMCREKFRDCWPVSDKKQEQQFRKVCTNWMTAISKDDADGHLPRISASLFMSPGGDRFYQMLFAFSRYVLYKTVMKENDVKVRDCMQYPALVPQASHLGDVVSKALASATVQQRREFMQQVQQTAVTHSQWKQQASVMVKRYRNLTKAVRERERGMQKLVKEGHGRAQFHRRKGSGDHSLAEYEHEVSSIKRSQRVQKVRDQWKQLDSFCTSSQREREVIESILDRTLEKYKIDARELDIKVPDLLLRECEKELQRRNVDNTYLGGKLNLLSVIHLWNLSLHLYIEKLHEVGVPNFGEATPTVTGQVHTHQAHLTNAQHLRSEIETRLLPELKAGIARIKAQLDGEEYEDTEAERLYIRQRFWQTKLGLLPPTPPVNFGADGPSPEGVTVPSVKGKTTRGAVATPEVVSGILDSVQKDARSQNASLVQGSPIFAPWQILRGKTTDINVAPASKLPKRSENVDVEKVGLKQRTRFKSAPSKSKWTGTRETSRSGFDVEKRGQVKVTASGTTLTVEPSDQHHSAKTAMTAQVIRHKALTSQDKVFKEPLTTVKKPTKSKHRTVAAHVERHSLGGTTPKAHRDLADQIADSVMAASPTREVLGAEHWEIDNPRSVLDQDAFQSKDKLPRTPVTVAVPDRHISSVAHLQQEDAEVDKIVTRLFSEENLDEDENILTIGSKTSMTSEGSRTVEGSELNRNAVNMAHIGQPWTQPNGDPLGLGLGNLENFHSISSTTDRDLLQFSLSEQEDTLKGSKSSSFSASDHNDTITSKSSPRTKPVKLEDMASSTKHSSPRTRREGSYVDPSSADVKLKDVPLSWPTLGDEEDELLTSITMPPSMMDDSGSAPKDKFMMTLSPDLLKSEMEKAELSLSARAHLGEGRENCGEGGENGDDTESVSTMDEPAAEKNVRINSRAEIIGEQDGQYEETSSSLLEGNRVVEFQNGQFTEYMDKSLLSDDESEIFLNNPSMKKNTLELSQDVNGAKNSSLLPNESVHLPVMDSVDSDNDNSDRGTASASRQNSTEASEQAEGRVATEVDDLINRYKMLKMNITTHESGVQSLPTQLDGASRKDPNVTLSPKSNSLPAPVIGEKYLERSPRKPGTEKAFRLDFDGDLFDTSQRMSAPSDRISQLVPSPFNTPKKGEATRKSPLGTPVRGLSSLPMSPSTSLLHANTSINDLLGEDDSILLPPSPDMNGARGKPPSTSGSPTGNLIDL